MSALAQTRPRDCPGGGIDADSDRTVTSPPFSVPSAPYNIFWKPLDKFPHQGEQRRLAEVLDSCFASRATRKMDRFDKLYSISKLRRMRMSRAKQASKRKRRAAAVTVPVLGAAGLSLSLAGGASAATGGATDDIQTKNTAADHQIILGDEEMSDVSLGTFYVFDKENATTPKLGEKIAWRGCGRCGGCGRGCGCRCGRCAGCGGCGWGWGCACSWGCGGCCLSWGGCRFC